MKYKIYQEIIDYWSMKEDECGLGVDWAEAHERCWRCGYKSRLQRCHIVPDSLGGASEASNLVLLCTRCHREAPNHANPKYMWIWLRSNCFPLYDAYWTNRGFEEFERMFGRKAFSDLGYDEYYKDKALKYLSEEITRTTIHFGEGRLNSSTIACVIAEVESRLTNNDLTN